MEIRDCDDENDDVVDCYRYDGVVAVVVIVVVMPVLVGIGVVLES